MPAQTPKQALGQAIQLIEQKKMEEALQREKERLVALAAKELADIMGPVIVQIADNARLSREEFKALVEEIAKAANPNINVDSPNVVVQPTPVTIPEIKVPEVRTEGLAKVIVDAIKSSVADAFKKVKIPQPQVTVQPAEVVMPEMPDSMKVDGPVQIVADAKNPIPVVIRDIKGNIIDLKTLFSIPMASGGPRIVKTDPIFERPVGFEQLAVSSSAVGLASIPEKANKAIMTVEDAGLRYREDGTAPDSTTGVLAYNGTTIILNSRESILAWRAIRSTATDSEVNVAYYEVR